MTDSSVPLYALLKLLIGLGEKSTIPAYKITKSYD